MRGAVGVAWRYGVANLSRRRAESVVQIAAFGLGMMVLLLLGLVRSDLLSRLASQLADQPAELLFHQYSAGGAQALEEFYSRITARDRHASFCR